MQLFEILLRNNLLSIPSTVNARSEVQTDDVVGTLVSNFLYFGYAPSKEVVDQFYKLNDLQITQVWKQAYDGLSKISGAQHNIGSHVLYKNFPREVLEMERGEYWLRQLFVYLGVPYEAVAEQPEQRESVLNELPLTVLKPSSDASQKNSDVENIADALVKSQTQWSDEQFDMIKGIACHYAYPLHNYLSLNEYGFKENGLALMLELCSQNEETNSIREQVERFHIPDATDVLRLVSGLSGNGFRLTENFAIRKFKRSERKVLLSKLENSANFENDITMRPEQFKVLLRHLHPGDYKKSFPRACAMYDRLYNKRYESENARLQKAIDNKDSNLAFELLRNKSGVFMRRFHELYQTFGEVVADEFINHIKALTTLQLVKFRKYIETTNEQQQRVVAPNGNWRKAQVIDNSKTPIDLAVIKKLQFEIGKELAKRIRDVYPDGFSLDERLKDVKLQTNAQKLASYGRGTVFDIPDNIQFLRTSSFWDSACSSFLDNTWNFFDEDWNSIGVCCWNVERAGERDYAIFSGDAVNSKDGKAAQLIDLYIDKMKEAGVRYAVWSILSYNKIPFGEFDEAHAGLQMGEEPMKGKLFEPSRVHFSFELNEKELTKIVAYLDIKERKIVYCDVNKGMRHSTGQRNQNLLNDFMPSYIDYLNTLPSYWDLLKNVNTPSGTPAVYDDGESALADNATKAFVFLKRDQKKEEVDFVDPQKQLLS